MITKEQAVEICRELGFSLNSQHLYYFQTGSMYNPSVDHTRGYYYVGYVSPNGSLTPATVLDSPIDVIAVLRGADAQLWSCGDIYYDISADAPRTMRLVDSVKFCVFDQLINPRQVPCSFYGYRFRK